MPDLTMITETICYFGTGCFGSKPDHKKHLTGYFIRYCIELHT